jgi:hypothetical protein
MKKIPLLLVMATMMWSFKLTDTAKNTSQSGDDGRKKEVATNIHHVNVVPTQLLHKSLNGLDSADVTTMATYFENNVFRKVKSRKMISFWFSRKVLDNILDLLEKEGAKGSQPTGAPDGIRIYYLSSKVDNSDLSIAVVSTKNIGRDVENPGSNIHQDYYYHHDNHPLFALANTDWQKNTDNCRGGALIYNSCPSGGCPAGGCGIEPEHVITQTYAVSMVSHFGRRKINTKSVWFDYKMLKNLSALKFTGIRIYLGNYGTRGNNGVTIPYDRVPGYPVGYYKKRRRDSFVFVTTKTIGDVEQDWFKCDYVDPSKHKFFDVYNNGELCPSHCN